MIALSRKGENIYKRKDGRWEGRFIKEYVGTKAKYGYIYGKSYKETKQKLSDARCIQQIKDIDNSCNDIAFSECYCHWLAEKKTVIKYSSYVKYKNMLELYITPFIGEKLVSKLGYDAISDLMSKLLAVAGKKQSGLSTKTVSDAITIVKSVIKYASRNKYEIDASAFDVVTKTSPKPLRVLSKNEQSKLVAYLLQDISNPYNLGVLISLFTGLRIGELCALKWGDISMEDRLINVRYTLQRIQTPGEEKKTAITITKPKSDCSIRQIPIPDALYMLLHSNENKSFYVLTNSSKYIEPRTLQNHFKEIISQCDIIDANFHSLRHTFATRCIELGFDIKCLSEILGHSNVNITLNRYVHPSFSLKKENMEKLSELFSVK